MFKVSKITTRESQLQSKLQLELEIEDSGINMEKNAIAAQEKNQDQDTDKYVHNREIIRLTIGNFYYLRAISIFSNPWTYMKGSSIPVLFKQAINYLYESLKHYNFTKSRIALCWHMQKVNPLQIEMNILKK